MRRSESLVLLMSSLLTLIGARATSAQEAVPVTPTCGVRDTSSHQLPFTQAENVDGARFVWFSNCRAGLPYAFISTADVPRSGNFTEIDATTPSGGPHAGDIVWWPKFMAILVSANGPIVTPEGRIPLAELVARYGTAHFYRRIVPKSS